MKELTFSLYKYATVLWCMNFHRIYVIAVGGVFLREGSETGRYGRNVSLTTKAEETNFCCRTTLVERDQAMAETAETKKEEADYKRVHNFPLIRNTDMPDEMRVETMELCVTACEKFATNNESAAKMIKESMDKKFGSSWHVVIGESFGFEITHEVKNLLYMFFGGSLAVCVWKCS
ncbi:dynein light chain 4, axonemal [Arapaima gigas]